MEIFIQGAEESTKPVILNNLVQFKVENYKKSIPAEIKGVDEMKIQGITIHKNKNCNTWYTRYRKDGEQVYISAKTQKECYDKLKEKLNIIKKEKQPKDYTLQSWYEKWLELFKIGKVKETTLKDYNRMLKHINKKLFSKEIKKITALEIKQNLEEIKAERQRQKIYDFLKDIFNKAKTYEIINENIIEKIEKPKHIKQIGCAMNNEEQKTFIENCKKDCNGTIFLITLYQGLRRGEVLALTKEDFNLKERTLRINKSQNELEKIETTKNKYSTRIIPLFENTFELIKNIYNKENKLFNYTTKTLQNYFKKILKKCNFKRNFRIHDLRHTFITNCKNQNIPEHIIQTWVGHNIGSSVTSRVYTHVTSDKNEIDLINKFYSDSTQKKED